MRKIARFGYRPDLGDPRDHLFAAPAAQLPASVDLRPRFPACWDQGDLGSCTAFALTGAMAFLHQGFVGSQLWLYYQERLAEGTVGSDAGAEIRDGIKVLAKLGCPPLVDWPYAVGRYRTKPPAKADADAKTDLITSYQRVANADLKAALAAGHPVVLGISAFESLESEAVAGTGNVPMPGKRERAIGGHAICVVGYKTDGRFIFRNSWGTSWGVSGYGFLPAAYLASADLATDAWVIQA